MCTRVNVCVFVSLCDLTAIPIGLGYRFCVVTVSCVGRLDDPSLTSNDAVVHCWTTQLLMHDIVV